MGSLGSGTAEVPAPRTVAFPDTGRALPRSAAIPDSNPAHASADNHSMRRFRFPLRGLLRLRRHAEREARRELGAALQRQQAAELRLHNVEQGLRDCQDQARGTTPTAKLAQAMETGLARMKLRAGAELRAAQAQVDMRRGIYLERRQELRAIDRLRERRHEEWWHAAQAVEQRELDELARLGRQARARAEVQA